MTRKEEPNHFFVGFILTFGWKRVVPPTYLLAYNVLINFNISAVYFLNSLLSFHCGLLIADYLHTPHYNSIIVVHMPHCRVRYSLFTAGYKTQNQPSNYSKISFGNLKNIGYMMIFEKNCFFTYIYLYSFRVN